jgi:hypothetical protein
MGAENIFFPEMFQDLDGNSGFLFPLTGMVFSNVVYGNISVAFPCYIPSISVSKHRMEFQPSSLEVSSDLDFMVFDVCLTLFDHHLVSQNDLYLFFQIC